MGSNHNTARAVARPPDQHHDGPSRRRRARALAVVASAGLFAACGGDDDESGTARASAEAAAFEPSGSAELAVGGDTVEAADEPAGGAAQSGTIELGAVGRDVIIEMQVSMSSDDIRRTVASISARASALGGGVASSNVDYGAPDSDVPSGYATLVVKVPPTAVEQLITGLGDAGTVHAITQNAQDVTEQLVDLDLRIANARQSVATVREFMDRTQNLTELVTLEAELTRRQTELEQLEAQERNLSDRVALSTITIGIVPTAAVPEQETDDGIADAFASGWSAFVGLLYGLVVVLAILTPFLATGLLVAALVWWTVRRGRAGGAQGTPVDADATDPVSDRDDVPSPTG